jgi:alkylation response protein AidB-like acyl-CoA dehydrogenase
MKRISFLNSRLTAKRGSFVDDSIKFLNFDESFFTPEINDFRARLRKDLEDQVAPYISESIEKAECVDKFVDVLKKHKVGRCYVRKPIGDGLDSRHLIACILELGRIDASLATFYLVQVILLGNTIGKLLIKMINCQTLMQMNGKNLKSWKKS